MTRELTRVKCLLVDDLDENLLALSALLRRDDVELLKARSGADALELLLANDDVALALIDVQMPEMDGFELAELMRGSERTRHIPIIFVTAGARDQIRVFQGYEAGAVDFLFKPIDSHILVSKADIFFQLYRQKQRLVQELQERTETLRLQEMFAGVLGHDLRTPLTAIVTGAQLLQHKAEDEGVQRIAGRMLSSGNRMARMIDDLLDLTRARLAGGIPVARRATELGPLISRTVQEQRIAFPDRAIELSQDGDLKGEWDPDRIAQVASNLISNALRHGADTEPVRVCVDGRARDTVTLTVINAGSIAEELIPHLFDPFRGGERKFERQEGLGLGLYIARQIVHAHDGSVDVKSEHPRVVFTVSIPRSAQPA